VVVRRHAIGDEVVCAGEAGDAMFVVVAGVLEVFLPQPTSAARRVGVLGPGDFFGEMSMLTGAARSASVVVRSAAILYEISHALIAPLLHHRPELADALAQAVAEHQRADADAVAIPPAERRQQQRSLVQNLAARIRAFLQR
jgi:CRP-like cAMP-binding protein